MSDTVLTYGFISIITIVLSFLLYQAIKYLYKRHFNGVKLPTETPKKFSFLEKLDRKNGIATSENGFVVFQSRNPTKYGFGRCLPENPPGVKFINKVLENHYGCHPGGEPKIQAPEGVLTVSIPRKYFRCRADCTNFVPRDGTEGNYSYQMLSGAIQATWFHLGEEKFLAGICLYLESPLCDWLFDNEQVKWALSSERLTITPNAAKLKTKKMQKVYCKLKNQSIIITRNQFGEIDKYVFNGRENLMEPVQCFDCHFELDDVTELIDDVGEKDPTPDDCLNWLKVEFCERMQRPMMIGKNLRGEIVHFEWNRVISKFQMKSCEKCAISGRNMFTISNEDDPPNYEHLEMIDTLVEME